MTPVLLASQSPRRQSLLGQLGVKPIVLRPPPHFNTESLEEVIANESPHDYVRRVAHNKQAAFAELIKSQTIAAPRNGLLLTADTTVAIDNTILGKPQTGAEAKAMLYALSGRTHEVFTAVAAVHMETQEQTDVVVRSEVEFAPLTESWITAYVQSGDPMDKAGGYGIQGAAGTMIPRIHGSMSAIMGLPLYETRMILIKFGALGDPLN
jgi:septum formation protein